MKKIVYLAAFVVTLASCKKENNDPAPEVTTPPSQTQETSAYLKEADVILTAAAQQRNVGKADFMSSLVNTGKFTAQENVFFPSALAIDIPGKKVTLPLYKGLGSAGDPVYFIMTESADYDVAKIMGLNYAPKLINGKGTAGSQVVTIENGMIKFKGNVDFAPVRMLEPGVFPNTLPPAKAEPGAIGDAEYSPLIILPSGAAMSVSIVANGTGTHDHLVSVDYAKGTVVFELLDGFQGGEQYYYHLVTESSGKVPATIERGIYTPRLANLPAFGKDMLTDKSALLGFAPTANGETGANNPERQGLNSTVLDGNAFDPINVFPLDPENNKKDNNNYSPMWDAHIYVWTDDAIKAGKRKRIKSFEQLSQLFNEGSIKDSPDNFGDPNSFVAGLKPTHAIINCPVIAQPKF